MKAVITKWNQLQVEKKPIPLDIKQQIQELCKSNVYWNLLLKK